MGLGKGLQDGVAVIVPLYREKGVTVQAGHLHQQAGVHMRRPMALQGGDVATSPGF